MPQSLYRYIWNVSGRAQIWLVILAVVVFPLSMLPLELQRRIINDAVKGEEPDLLLLLCGAYLAVVLVQGGLKYVLRISSGRVSEKVTASLREAVYHCIYTVVPPSSWKTDEGRSVDQGTVVAMLTAEVEKLGGFAGASLSTPLLQAGTMLTVLAYMIWVEPMVALLALALYSPQLIVVPLLQRRIDERAEERARCIRDLGDFVVANADAARQETGVPDTFGRLIGRIAGIRMSIYRLKYAMKFFNNFIGHLGPLGVLLVGGWFVMQGRTEVGTIVAFISGFDRLGPPWRELIAFYRQVMDAHMRYALLVSTFPPFAPGQALPPGGARAGASGA